MELSDVYKVFVIIFDGIMKIDGNFIYLILIVFVNEKCVDSG